MPRPPAYRDHDQNPRRGDDIRVKGFGIEVEANGRSVIIVILAIVIILLGVWAWWDARGEMRIHDSRTAEDHRELIRAIEIQTCVLTLDVGDERKAWREEGRYCPTSRERERTMTSEEGQKR